MQVPESGPPDLEVVSVTEEELPSVETPNTLNVSPLGSPTESPTTAKEPRGAEEGPPKAPSSPTMPVTKVQPFMNGEAKALPAHP